MRPNLVLSSLVAALALCLPIILLAQTKDAELSKPEEVETSLRAVTGKVLLPDEAPEGINTEGLSIGQVILRLHGKVKRPYMPYPKNWSDMAGEQRAAWRKNFEESDDFEIYQRKLKEAIAKRATYKTNIAEDGSFTFENVKPAWYQLSAAIMHPSAQGSLSRKLARGYALRQFFVKKGEGPQRVGQLKLKLKNVLAPGDSAPDWNVSGCQGGEIRLSEFRGKFVLLDFWATWCRPCRAELPNLKAIHEKFGGQRLQVIGLNTDDTIDVAKAMLEKHPVSYRQGYLGAGAENDKVFRAYGIQTIPSIWLIGPDGKIVARDLLGDAIAEAIESAFVAEYGDQSKQAEKSR